jgi:DNA replication protein DnaC
MARDLDDLVDDLRRLGIRTTIEPLRAFLAHAIQARLGPLETVEQLVTIERRERERRNLERRTRGAHLGMVTPLDRFDWSHPRRIDRALIDKLHTLAFIEAAQNVLFRGPSGVGKTTLAKHLGLAALERGHSVRFATLAEVLADLLKQESAPAIERRLRRYVLPDVLILDEVGYLPCDADAANLLYAIIDRRHEKRATIVTTNLSFKQWGSVFPGAACVVALVDRFAQHCHVVDIDADSWRQRHALSRDGAERPAAAPLPARAASRPARARA